MGIIINNTLEKYNEYIKKNLSSKRYIHSLGVSYIAAALAMKYNIDIYKAQTAGLLHDCAKSIKHSELIDKCKKANIALSEIEYNSPELLHSKYGAYIARKKFNIEDSDIIDAIYYHTTGRPNMQILEKIIFVADYIEPNRSNLPQLNTIRQLAFENIDKAIEMICNSTIEYLKSNDADIDTETLNTLEYYKSQNNEVQ